MRDTNVIAFPITSLSYLRLPAAISFRVAVAVAFLGIYDTERVVAQVNPFQGKAAQPKAAAPNTKKSNVATPKPIVEMKIDPEKLPEGFNPPPEKDPLMSLVKEVVPAEELEKLRKEGIDGKFTAALRKADGSDAGKKVIKDGIRYRLGLMCLEENRKVGDAKKNLFELRNRLWSDIDTAASADRTLKPSQVKEFRQFVMQELVTQSTGLLDNNYYVRLQICLLLGDLELVKENAQGGVKLEIFTPAHVPLLKVIGDPNQPEKVKIAAIYGLRRILKDGTPDVTTRTKIGDMVMQEFRDVSRHPWYQMRLAGLLGGVDVQQPSRAGVVQALREIVSDPKRDWSVRAEAAKSLGRVPIPAGTNPTLIVTAIADLALQLSKAIQQATNPNNPELKSAMVKVYLAFHEADATDVDATKQLKGGLLNNPVTKEVGNAAYSVIVPITADVLKDKRLTAASIAALDAWLKQNSPSVPTPPNPGTGEK